MLRISFIVVTAILSLGSLPVHALGKYYGGKVSQTQNGKAVSNRLVLCRAEETDALNIFCAHYSADEKVGIPIRFFIKKLSTGFFLFHLIDPSKNLTLNLKKSSSIEEEKMTGDGVAEDGSPIAVTMITSTPYIRISLEVKSLATNSVAIFNLDTKSITPIDFGVDFFLLKNRNDLATLQGKK